MNKVVKTIIIVVLVALAGIGIYFLVTSQLNAQRERSFDEFLELSDGVADAFATDEALQDFVKSVYSPNPQTIADKLLEQALANCNGRAMDDMTVLVIKAFNNN